MGNIRKTRSRKKRFSATPPLATNVGKCYVKTFLSFGESSPAGCSVSCAIRKNTDSLASYHSENVRNRNEKMGKFLFLVGKTGGKSPKNTKKTLLFLNISINFNLSSQNYRRVKNF